MCITTTATTSTNRHLSNDMDFDMLANLGFLDSICSCNATQHLQYAKTQSIKAKAGFDDEEEGGEWSDDGQWGEEDFDDEMGGYEQYDDDDYQNPDSEYEE